MVALGWEVDSYERGTPVVYAVGGGEGEGEGEVHFRRIMHPGRVGPAVIGTKLISPIT